ncbi:DUF3331 domain-containing protein [Paraburkholderia sp. CNPSo 3157]|uniref:DUF3331 domain-containing protein n=1 Tax=Paraburkholderia franconis TaxID=2654983 RepID=A0A7X1THE0_9BURK|nr:DUF3331 domain-containing protein [Paraburkholderia franconis]MPW19243.1 DUF3331 domain-containing protein [Paraburkholderia franconis]
MVSRVEDDIVIHALLGVLMSRPMDSGSRDRRSREKKVRLKKSVMSGAFEPVDRGRPPTQICILEQPSSITLSVYWSDACSGHYADQEWRMGVAREDSLCVLTGMSIRRGDSVFRPRVHGTQCPGNYGRMILASAVPGYLGT